ncbi:MAG: hypothetical protein F4Y50_13770 [Dehalococcoidia bacterium]|nr:hypothetical protein [Dehalococcoidia bacterium]
MRQAGTWVRRAHDQQRRCCNSATDTRRHQRYLHRWRPRRHEYVVRLKEVRLSSHTPPHPNLAQSLKRQPIVDNVGTLDDEKPPVPWLGTGPTPRHSESLVDVGEL